MVSWVFLSDAWLTLNQTRDTSAVIEGVIGSVDHLTGSEMHSLVLRRHRIKDTSEVGSAILGKNKKRLREILDELRGSQKPGAVVDIVDGAFADGPDDTEDGELVLHEAEAQAVTAADDHDAGSPTGADDPDSKDGTSCTEPKLPALRTAETFKATETITRLALGSDDDAVRFMVASRVHRLWQDLHLFRKASDQADYIREVRGQYDPEGPNAYLSEVYGEFLRQYDTSVALDVPERWSFGIRRGEVFDPAQVRQPNLMQRHVAVMVDERRLFGNWSGTGTGKTASAVLSAMVTGARRILVVCPNNTVAGWAETIESCDPDATVETKTFTPEWGTTDSETADGAQWLVVNFDRLSTRGAEAVEAVKALGFDMLVVDEVHWTKRREDKVESKRRKTLMAMRKALPEDVKVIGMSATPVVNDITEGRSLIELIEGQAPEIGTALTRDNAVLLHEHLIRVGFRSIVSPEVGLEEDRPSIDISPLRDALLVPGLSHYEIDAVVARQYIPTVVDLARQARSRGKGVLVYTEYDEGIIGPYTLALQAAGLRVGHFDGKREKADIAELGDTCDVLIGTRAIGTGVDGVQHWADTVCYVSLPWTAAEFEQSRARVYRQGSTAGSVKVVIPTGVIPTDDGDWSWTEFRWNRIRGKRDIAAAAVDGEIPEEFLASPAKATRAAMDILQRLTAVEEAQAA